MTPHTDDLLGAALRELEVPEHRPEFHRELRRRLRAERGSARRIRYGALLAAAAIVAAIAAVTLRQGGTPTAEAAVVQASMRAGLAAFRNVTGEVVASGIGQGKTVRFRAAVDARGDIRVEGPRPGDVLVFDAQDLTYRSAQHSASVAGPTIFYAERTGVPLGPPDLGGSLGGLQELGGYVQLALAAHDPAVEDVTYLGRPAWRLALRGLRTRVTVDKASGMVVDADDLLHHRRIRFVRFTFNRPLPPATFTLRFPQGAEVSRTDSGFRVASAGKAPLLPAWLPAGFELVRTARDFDVWNLLYRRGFAEIVVTVGAGPVDWSTAAGVNHAQTVRRGLTVTAAGALPRADLERIVHSAR